MMGNWSLGGVGGGAEAALTVSAAPGGQAGGVRPPQASPDSAKNPTAQPVLCPLPQVRHSSFVWETTGALGQPR